MRRPIAVVAVAAFFAFSLAGTSNAEPLFLEGHVFKNRIGVPLPGARVEVELFDPLRQLVGRIILGTVVTDANGFYAVELDHPSDFTGFRPQIVILVRCETPGGEVTGVSQASPRPGQIRRDVYLSLPSPVSNCDASH